jgi:hypothetical protein
MVKGLSDTPAVMASGCDPSNTATWLWGCAASARLEWVSENGSVKSSACSIFRTDRLLNRRTGAGKSRKAEADDLREAWRGWRLLAAPRRL